MNFLSVFLAFSILILSSSSAWAAGQLQLTVVTGATTRVLTISDFGNGEFAGHLVTNGGLPQPVTAFFSNSELQISIGLENSVISVSRSSSDVLYEGVLSTRLLDVDVDVKGGKLKYGGERVGDFDDFSGKSDDAKISLNLFWEKNRLDLGRDVNSGSCKGTVRSGNTLIHDVKCTSSGDLTDVFFRDSDHVIAWLVNLLSV